jgi:hypothetical protein
MKIKTIALAYGIPHRDLNGEALFGHRVGAGVRGLIRADPLCEAPQ